MVQEAAWEREYRRSKLLTKENEPQNDVVRFVHWLKKEQGIKPDGLSVLDLGSGTGRNSFYFTELGAEATGLEISRTALELAQKRAVDANLRIAYKKHSIGELLPFADNSFDIILDITSSNSLSTPERKIYLAETHRVLKPGGIFFVKALAKDGDANAKQLLKMSPGSEPDTYVLPELGITERIWTRADFEAAYGTYFTFLFIDKKTSYSQMNNRSYKRNFWIAYMKK